MARERGPVRGHDIPAGSTPIAKNGWQNLGKCLQQSDSVKALNAGIYFDSEQQEKAVLELHRCVVNYPKTITIHWNRLHGANGCGQPPRARTERAKKPEKDNGGTE